MDEKRMEGAKTKNEDASKINDKIYNIFKKSQKSDLVKKIACKVQDHNKKKTYSKEKLLRRRCNCTSIFACAEFLT